MPLIDQLNDLLSSLGGFGPILWLSFAFCALLIAELILARTTSSAQKRKWLAIVTILALGITTYWTVASSTRGFLFLHLLFVDNQAIFLQLLIALAGIFVVLYELITTSDHVVTSTTSSARSERLPVEWYSLLLAMLIGLFLMTISVNLLSIYLSIELVSICSYLLTALTAERKASEGGLKYLLFGAVSSAIMLYGMSLLYGITGTLDLTTEAFGMELAHQDSAVVIVAMLLTLAGLLFKLAGVPFHIWTPDAYEAAPIPVAAFFSVAPKAAAILVLMRLVTVLPAELSTADMILGASTASLQTPLAVLALAGILIGNLSALRQTNAKRLLAYSTIAHAGFLLVGVVAFNQAGFEAVFFYISTYLFISLAAFFLIDLLARRVNQEESVDRFTLSRLTGLGAKFPFIAVALTVVMLALTGLPPTVGFTAKLLAFSALFDAYQHSSDNWLLALFVLGLLNALISLVYYLKIPFLLFFRATPESNRIDTSELPVSVLLLTLVLVIPIIGLFVKPDWLLNVMAGW